MSPPLAVGAFLAGRRHSLDDRLGAALWAVDANGTQVEWHQITLDP